MGAPSLIPGWETTSGPRSWVTLQREAHLPFEIDHLAAQATLPGPRKYVVRHGRLEERLEVFMNGSLTDGDDPLAGSRPVEEDWEFVRRFLGAALDNDALPGLANWQAPPAEMIADWVNQAGHESAIDQDKNLRLTLKRRGCDGQVRLERGAGSFRLVLPLGQWADLDDVAATAMRELIRAANAQDRLVRIAWLTHENTRRCEAQVDLSGLMSGNDEDTRPWRVWRDMVGLAVSGLDLALRQLGGELPLLAEGRHHDLAQLLLAERKHEHAH